jgi:alpha-tubulin suppressor-like RCC1 family protein
MSSVRVTTNFRDNNGTDLGDKLVTKDYLISVYPEIGDKIGIPPELWVWGVGFNGRLGNASTTSASTPVTTFTGGTNWKQVSSGRGHTAAIKTDGTLWTWGDGGNGRLGTNDTTTRSTPVTTFAGGTNWKQVSTGTQHTAAIKTDGTLWTWGDQDRGTLGNGVTTGNRSTPVTTFAGGTNWKQVSCANQSSGGANIAAIKSDGTLWTWGSGDSGRLGVGDTLSRSTPVTTFAGGTNWKQVSVGDQHTAAVKTDGTLWLWGTQFGGRLGNGDASTSNASTPVTTFAGGTNWKQVSAAGFNTAAIKTDGTLWVWGNGTNGRLGNAVITGDVSTPVTTFAGGTNWKQVSSGNQELGATSHTAAIKTDGTLWVWGSGNDGKLGTNDATTRSTPVTTFAGGTNWKQVSSGTYHTAAIKSVDFTAF